jgi:hypothetical protein
MTTAVQFTSRVGERVFALEDGGSVAGRSSKPPSLIDTLLSRITSKSLKAKHCVTPKSLHICESALYHGIPTQLKQEKLFP